jgi:hypothetical protein
MSSIFTLTSPDKCEDYREHAFYPTPWDATEAFMLAEEEYLKQYNRVDEPACGDGGMSEVIRGHGKNVRSTDLIYRGYGVGETDFLDINFQKTARCLLTNPPFPLAEDFIRHAHRLGYEYIGMILKANYWNAKTRIPLFVEHKPVRVYPYSWRIDFTGDGANHFDCIFVVWIPAQSGNCEFCIPLERPKFLSQPTLF